ncbi:MAG: DUF4416 family protein [Deltaproteobacteria bacterium]|nr:DUF4416 family protein [Deltaproteobacteria bacterium]
MGRSIYPAESKAILFLLTAEEKSAPPALEAFSEILGPVELQGPWHPFTHSHYYEQEMGKNLKRRLIGFKNIFQPHRLVELKDLAKKCEGEKRKINVDPGYVDLFKVVLASGKGGGMKTALTAETFAYPILRFEKGLWHPFAWTFPDFKEAAYHNDLLKIREGLRKELSNRF